VSRVAGLCVLKVSVVTCGTDTFLLNLKVMFLNVVIQLSSIEQNDYYCRYKCLNFLKSLHTCSYIHCDVIMKSVLDLAYFFSSYFSPRDFIMFMKIIIKLRPAAVIVIGIVDVHGS